MKEPAQQDKTILGNNSSTLAKHHGTNCDFNTTPDNKSLVRKQEDHPHQGLTRQPSLHTR